MRLIDTMLKMEKVEEKAEAKMEVMEMCRALMPNSQPDYLSVIKFPTITVLVAQQGAKTIHKVLLLLVKDFCNSLNVVRNMNEDQMIEAAGLLIDECDNFRLEDYVMMFQMAKKGQLVKIMDRIDLQKITEMLDEYWSKRHEAGEKQYDEENMHLDSLGSSEKLIESVHNQDAKILAIGDKFSSELNKIKDMVVNKIGNREERAKLKEIEIEDSEKVRQRLKEKGYETT